MDWPNMDFHNGVWSLKEDIHFDPQSTPDFRNGVWSLGEVGHFDPQSPPVFQGDLPGRKIDVCPSTFWDPQGALTGPQGHISPPIYQEPRLLYDNSTAFRDESELQHHSHIAGHPQWEETRRFSDGTENARSVLDRVHESTQHNTGYQGPWIGYRQQDKWALMPNLKPNLGEDLPSLPALIHPEPRTEPQPRCETNANPKPRKSPTAKRGSVRINASKSPNKRLTPGPEIRIFKSSNMKELSKRPRVLSEDQRNHAARVRKAGACTPCRRGHRKCLHVAEEPSSPGTDDPVTPNGDVPMEISVYTPTDTGLQYQ